MFSRLPMYQTQGASAFRKDLTNIRILCEHLGNPEKNLRCIHVAGTNGKGSTSHMLASVFQTAGYKTGLYTSPHLLDYRERIRINGQPIPIDAVMAFVHEHKPFFEKHQMSFFEMSVGLAFWYFREEKTDIAIIETGLGGRLDATNVVTPIASVITNIGMDHMQFLGNSLESIASEKAGIIKENVPVIVGEYLPETKKVFEEKASELYAPIVFASDISLPQMASDLKGDYQKHNIKTVLATIDAIKNDWKISDADVADGLLNVSKNTGLRGRWEILGENPLIIADTAHNSHGLRPVMDQLLALDFEKLHIVLGVVNDKDLSEILPLMPKSAKYYFAKPNIPRGLPGGELSEKAGNYGLSGNVFHSIAEAYRNAIHNAGEKDVIYAGGSTFVVAEILE